MFFRKVDVGKFSAIKILFLSLLLLKTYFKNVVCGSHRIANCNAEGLHSLLSLEPEIL